jgi:4-amino-4-deoxy-L-arabinose transferase-like glycosyltransferase
LTHPETDDPRDRRAATALAIRFPLATLALLCLVLWTPGILNLPPLDRDESRFAQSSRQMLESGDLVDIRFGKEPRYKKPVGIYWLQVATTELAGRGARDRIWTYRLASLIGGIASVWLAWWTARAIAPPRTALLAAALLASTLLLDVEATIATTDAVLLACILGAQGALLRHYVAARGKDASAAPGRVLLAGWAALGLGVLVKGPVAPAVCASTAIALAIWDRDWRWLRGIRLIPGLAVVALIVAPWAIAIGLASHGQFFSQSLGTDFGQKLIGEQEAHGAPPGYYLVLTTLTFWPATLFALPGLREAIAKRRELPERFLVAWAASAWLLFEISPTKLPHYILPAYPALAVMGALWAARAETVGPVRSAWRYSALVQFLIGAAVLVAASLVLPARFGTGPDLALIAMAVLSFLAAATGAFLFTRVNNVPAATAGIASAALLYAALTMLAAPRLQQLWVSTRVAAVAARNIDPGDAPAVVAGFQEPSLVFQLGTPTMLTDGRGAANAILKARGLAIVEDSQRGAFMSRLGELRAVPIPVGEVAGLNYSRGRPVHVTVYRLRAAP